jgi:hypothetical protein
MRQMRAAAVEDVLSKMFKRTPEGWTLDSPYPQIFGWRRWTYLLTDAQKERLAERIRRGMRTTYLVTIGFDRRAAQLELSSATEKESHQRIL